MHRVLVGQNSSDSWFAKCVDCGWTHEWESSKTMQEVAEKHGEVMPGGFMPRAYVEALVLGIMSLPDGEE